MKHTHIAAATLVQPGQRGLSLVELLVGLLLGLLIIGVALGALMASRAVSGTVSDASQLQQQASHIFRVMGRQIRQAGSLRLLLSPAKKGTDTVDVADPVAFEASAQDFNPAHDTILGLDAPGRAQYKLTVGYSNYTQPLHGSAIETSLQRNCLGQTNSHNLILSRFALDARKNTLRCTGAPSAGAQPLAQNVANFQVRYLIQSPKGDARLQYVNAAAVGQDWSRVVAAEVCLVLFGIEVINMPADSRYTDCASSDGTAESIDMTTLPAPRTRRLHMVFRSVYQLRSQGMAG